MRYGLLTRVLFVTLDLRDGRRRTLSKFRVLGVIMHYVAENPTLEAEPFESLERVATARFR